MCTCIPLFLELFPYVKLDLVFVHWPMNECSLLQTILRQTNLTTIVINYLQKRLKIFQFFGPPLICPFVFLLCAQLATFEQNCFFIDTN